jgi:cyclopropane fatty-acyl-phospholipid synthase-like methyltransferase
MKSDQTQGVVAEPDALEPESRYLSGGYLEHNPTWHTEDSAWKAQHIASLLRNDRLNFSSVCDVGCGAGEITRILAESFPGKEFAGYEISPDAFALSRTKERANLRFRNAEPFQSGNKFDVALAIDVFEHVEDYFGFLRNMRRISKYQIYHIPLDLSAQAVFRGWPFQAARDSVGHIHYFSKDTALATLRDTGHEVADWFYTRPAIELASSSIKRRIAAWPRSVAFGLAPDFAARVLGGFSLMVLCE